MNNNNIKLVNDEEIIGKNLKYSMYMWTYDDKYPLEKSKCLSFNLMEMYALNSWIVIGDKYNCKVTIRNGKILLVFGFVGRKLNCSNNGHVCPKFLSPYWLLKFDSNQFHIHCFMKKFCIFSPILWDKVYLKGFLNTLLKMRLGRILLLKYYGIHFDYN